jgi:zinc transporter
MLEEPPFHVPPHMPVHPQKALVPADPVLALQLDGNGHYHKLSAGGAVPSERCWLHLDYSADSAKDWLHHSPLLPEVVRESLLGDSNRPKLVKVNGGMLLTLRGINHNEGQRPDQMVAIRFFITEQLIVSTRHRRVYAIEQVVRNLRQGIGPRTTADWLVDVCENLAEQAGNFIDEMMDNIVRLEDEILEHRTPSRRELVEIRRQLIVLRRYLAPQRDVFSRLANEKISWLEADDLRHLQEIADRMGRWLEDLDASIARTSLLADEINALMTESMNRRTYIMSLFAMVFLPLSFFTGLLGVNLGGIPGGDSPWGFLNFCLLLLTIAGGILLWLKLRKWV